MPYKDPEKQKEAVRTASARWYQRNRDDEDFLKHRAQNARKNSGRIMERERVRRAQNRETDVCAALARFQATILSTPNLNPNDTDDQVLRAEDSAT